MKNKNTVFFFSLLMVFMPFNMKGMETMAVKMKDMAGFLDKHSGAVFMATLGVLAALSYDEVADSEEEDFVNRAVKKQEPDKFKPLKDTKKTSEQNQVFPVGESDDDEPSAMGISDWGLLWTIGSK